jgi:hypothetical protein
VRFVHVLEERSFIAIALEWVAKREHAVFR